MGDSLLHGGLREGYMYMVTMAAITAFVSNHQ